MELKDKVIEEIKKIYDPEIPVNIYDLGLIYDISINKKNVSIKIVKDITSKGFVRNDYKRKLVDLSDIRINLKGKK